MKKTTEKRVEKLINISKAELLEKGISGFSFDKAISSTSLSKATVYKLFINKEGFIKAVIKSALEDMIPPFKKLLDKYKSLSDVLDDLEKINFDVKSIIKQYPIEDLIDHKEYTFYINKFYYEYFGKIIIDKIKEFQNSGEIRNDINAIYIFEFITSVTKGMGNMLIDKNFKDVVNNYNKLIMNAIKGKGDI